MLRARLMKGWRWWKTVIRSAVTHPPNTTYHPHDKTIRLFARTMLAELQTRTLAREILPWKSATLRSDGRPDSLTSDTFFHTEYVIGLRKIVLISMLRMIHR